MSNDTITEPTDEVSSDEVSDEVSETPEDGAQEGPLDGDHHRFVVRLAVPVDTTDPEAALELVMQDIAYYGLKQYIWLVEHAATGGQWYVGEQGIMSADEVDGLAGETPDPEALLADANDAVPSQG